MKGQTLYSSTVLVVLPLPQSRLAKQQQKNPTKSIDKYVFVNWNVWTGLKSGSWWLEWSFHFIHIEIRPCFPLTCCVNGHRCGNQELNRPKCIQDINLWCQPMVKSKQLSQTHLYESHRLFIKYLVALISFWFLLRPFCFVFTTQHIS